MPQPGVNSSRNTIEPMGPINLAGDGLLSPTALAGDNNNYSPTSWGENVTVLRVDPGGASRNLTGLAATAHGHVVLLLNIADGAEDLVLVNQSTSSTAANRFYASNNANVTLRRGSGIFLFYDGVDNRWKCVNI
jgi:hypothetical protein